jgi:hypothetical protein
MANKHRLVTYFLKCKQQFFVPIALEFFQPEVVMWSTHFNSKDRVTQSEKLNMLISSLAAKQLASQEGLCTVE